VSRDADVARVEVRKDLGSLLMLRSTVAPLFRKVERFDAPRVILDFSGVEFMSRSFADEYLTAKAAGQKRIEERRVPVEVRRMLELVSNRLGSSRSRPTRLNEPLPRVRVVSL
jgi:hypothetical protein